MNKVNNQESFDGIPVTIYEGKFGGFFDLADEVGENVKYDDVVCFIVTASAGAANMSTTKTGDMKRRNTFEIMNVLPIEPDVAEAFFTAGASVAPTAQAAQYVATLYGDDDE